MHMRFSLGIKAKLFSILVVTCVVSLAGLGFLASAIRKPASAMRSSLIRTHQPQS